jgi:hypothetical protein
MQTKIIVTIIVLFCVKHVLFYFSFSVDSNAANKANQIWIKAAALDYFPVLFFVKGNGANEASVCAIN